MRFSISWKMSWITKIHLFILVAALVGAKPMEEKVPISTTLPKFPPEKLPQAQGFSSLEGQEHRDEDFVLLSQSETPESSSNKEFYEGISPKRRILSFTGSGSGMTGSGGGQQMGPLLNLFALTCVISSVLGLLNVLLPLDLLGKLLGSGMGNGGSGSSHSYGMHSLKPLQDVVSSSSYYKYRE